MTGTVSEVSKTSIFVQIVTRAYSLIPVLLWNGSRFGWTIGLSSGHVTLVTHGRVLLGTSLSSNVGNHWTCFLPSPTLPTLTSHALGTVKETPMRLAGMASLISAMKCSCPTSPYAQVIGDWPRLYFLPCVDTFRGLRLATPTHRINILAASV